jgi:hypothetical protein
MATRTEEILVGRFLKEKGERRRKERGREKKRKGEEERRRRRRERKNPPWFRIFGRVPSNLNRLLHV